MTSHDPEDVVTEFYIDGAWTSTYAGQDLAARVRGGDAVRITSGGADQFASITSRSASFTLNNADNLFTDDDPNSPLFRKFGQNTRMRHSVLHPTRNYDLYAKFMDQPIEPNGARIYTADKASLDITGDIDVRWEMDMRNTRDLSQVIMSKMTLSSNLSWLVYVNTSGQIVFTHTTGGTAATLLAAFSDAGTVPEVEGRKAYRVTLDVNDGAGNRVYTWYTSDTIDGTWTQVDTATTAGTTSIFSGTSSLAIGAGGNGDIIFSTVYPFRGRMYAAQVRSGIGGTLVADFRPNTDAELGDVTWADTCASPNTWIIETAATVDTLPSIRLGSDRVRATLEIQTRPDDWDPSGTDRWCAMTAQGTLARYQSTRGDLKSAERRYWTRQDGVVGYWPLEDGRDATTASSALDGGTAGAIVGCTFGDATGFPGSAGSLTLEQAAASTALFRASPHTATGAWGVIIYINLQELPASTAVLCNIYPKSSTVHRWTIEINVAAFDFKAYDIYGATISSGSAAFGAGVNPAATDGWTAVSMTFKQSGANIIWETTWHQVGENTFYSHTGGGTTVAGTVGTIDRMFFTPTDAAYDGARISHVVMVNYEYEIGAAEFAEVSRGFAGETWGRRWLRLLTEEGITPEWVGDLDLTEECGPQPTDTLYSICEAGAKLDGGLVTEARDLINAWRYVTGAALGNRRRLELSYSGSEITDIPRPTGDGRYLVNDFTASRDDGGSARYEATDTRRKNVREPDDPTSPGVGRVERSDTYNAYEDARMWYLASNRVHLGTWDERIIPTLTVDTHRSQISGSAALLADAIAQDIGDPIAVTDVSGSPLPPNDIRSVTTGCTETIDNLTHRMVFNTVVQGPYDVPVLESESDLYVITLAEEDTETVLASSLTTTATSIAWKTDATYTCPYWVDGSVDLEIDIGGERISISSITAPSLVSGFYEQTATVSARSVNSVVKAHDAGDVVRVFRPSYLGRI